MPETALGMLPEPVVCTRKRQSACWPTPTRQPEFVGPCRDRRSLGRLVGRFREPGCATQHRLTECDPPAGLGKRLEGPHRRQEKRCEQDVGQRRPELALAVEDLFAMNDESVDRHGPVADVNWRHPRPEEVNIIGIARIRDVAARKPSSGTTRERWEEDRLTHVGVPHRTKRVEVRVLPV